MTWHLMDLLTDDKTGRLRETKLWSNISKAATQKVVQLVVGLVLVAISAGVTLLLTGYLK